MPRVRSSLGPTTKRAAVSGGRPASSAARVKTPAKKPAAAGSSFSSRTATTPLNLTGASARARGPGVKLIDNDAYFPELTRLLGNAKKSVDLVEYNFFSESGHGQQLADQLIAAKKKNPDLKIRLFIEADHGDGAKRNALTMKKLEAAGIEVDPDSKNLVTHAKAVCVDSRYVLAGSHNLTNTSMSKNNETSLSIDSPALAKGYEQYFQSLLKQPDQLHPSTVHSGAVTMLTDTAYEDQLLEVIKTAKTSLDASMYDLNFTGKDPKAQEVMDALADAAKRGVKVNLMLEQGTPAFAPEITRANEAAAKWLQARGVTVHLDSPGQISHQKFIVRDRQEVLMGSTNWTGSDFDKRHQLNWRVKEPALAKQFSATLANEIATEGVPLSG